jgi:CheY-like chemotaxis protein
MESGAGERGPALVLVCDDTEQIRRLIRTNLELEGHEVVETADGEQALAHLRDTSLPLPDVITLDAHMAPGDGWWAIEQIRADERLAGIPVVMVTASVQNHDRAQARAAGLDAFIAKPFDPDALLDVVAGYLAHGRGFDPGD